MTTVSGTTQSDQRVRLLRDGLVVATGDDALNEAADRLIGGDVVAIPTDTVYGLAASLGSPEALTSIFRIKGRAADKSLPVLIDDVATAARLIRAPAGATDGRLDLLLTLASRYWPGALTVALPGHGDLPPAVLAHDGTVGLRLPDSRVARDVIGRAGGALAVTSANPSGSEPALDADDVGKLLGSGRSGLRWVLDAGAAPGGVASTVIGLEGEHLVVHRHGAVGAGELQEQWVAIRRHSTGLPR